MGRLTSVSPQSLSQDHKSLHDHYEWVSSSTLAITRVESGVCSLSPSLQHWGWQWVPAPGRPRLLAFSPSTRARLISPGRCRDTFWSESGDFWERSPGSARSSDLPRAARGPPGNENWEPVVRNIYMNDEVISLFQLSLNDSVFLLMMGGAPGAH